VQNICRDDALAHSRASIYLRNKYGNAVEGGVIDSASFADTGLGHEAGRGGRADVMNSLGCRWQPSETGEGSRIAGKSLVHAACT
jgi:hypothetical protein